MPTITGMKAFGYYDENSSTQRAGIETLFPWLAEAARSLPEPASGLPLVLADLGSSQGRNAIGAMAYLVGAIRERTDHPIQLAFCDLPTNDFNRLFANLEEARRFSVFPRETYACAVGGSFYAALFPPASLCFASTYNALHFLDEVPSIPAPGTLMHRAPRPGADPHDPSYAAAIAFSRQAARDLETFLRCRARELMPGGRLLIATPGDPHDEAATGIPALLATVLLDMVDDGFLPHDRVRRMFMPVYMRNLDEMTAPVAGKDAPLAREFEVERAETIDVEVPFVADYLRTHDAVAFGLAFSRFMRAFSEPILYAALEGLNEREAILEAIYDRIAHRMAADPERYAFRLGQVAMVLRRR